MYRYTKPVDWCQCCQQGVSLADFQGSSDFFGNHNSPQIVHPTNNSCCFHISFSFSAASLGPLFEGAGTAKAVTGGVSHRTYDTPSVICSANATSLKEGGKATPTFVLQITLLVYAATFLFSSPRVSLQGWLPTEIIPYKKRLGQHSTRK